MHFTPPAFVKKPQAQHFLTLYSYTAYAKPESTGCAGHVAAAAVEAQEVLSDLLDRTVTPIVTYVAYVPNIIIRVAEPRCGQKELSRWWYAEHRISWCAEKTTVYAVVTYPTQTCFVDEPLKLARGGRTPTFGARVITFVAPSGKKYSCTVWILSKHAGFQITSCPINIVNLHITIGTYADFARYRYQACGGVQAALCGYSNNCVAF